MGRRWRGALSALTAVLLTAGTAVLASTADASRTETYAEPAPALVVAEVVSTEAETTTSPPVTPEPPAPAPVVSAPAAPTPPPAATPGPVERAQSLLDTLRYPWRDLGWEIAFFPARKGHLGSADFRHRRIEIYVRPGQSDAALAHVIAHEVGHAVDFEYGTSERRRTWRELRGLDPAMPWSGCSGCTDYATPAGDFAEVFAWWLVGKAGGFKGELAGPPDAARMEPLIPLFFR